MSQNHHEWLESLQPGDVVYIDEWYGYGRKGKVTRLTKTLIMVGKRGALSKYEARYRKKDGVAPGSGYGSSMIREMTPDRLALIERRVLLEKIKSHDPLAYTNETLAAVLKAYETGRVKDR